MATLSEVNSFAAKFKAADKASGGSGTFSSNTSSGNSSSGSSDGSGSSPTPLYGDALKLQQTLSAAGITVTDSQMKAAISAQSGGSSVTAPKNTYNYVDASGNIKQVTASSAEEAMKNAPGIADTSGVQLVSANSPAAAVTSTEVRDNIQETKPITP
jgi:hypothetical protein